MASEANTQSTRRASARWRKDSADAVVRINAGGGGADLTIAEAEAFRSELDQAIAATRDCEGLVEKIFEVRVRNSPFPDYPTVDRMRQILLFGLSVLPGELTVVENTERECRDLPLEIDLKCE